MVQRRFRPAFASKLWRAKPESDAAINNPVNPVNPVGYGCCPASWAMHLERSQALSGGIISCIASIKEGRSSSREPGDWEIDYLTQDAL
jgi:hypothetical protein